MTAKRPILRLFAVLSVELVGFGMVIPVLPYFTEELGGDAFVTGLLFAAQFTGQFLLAPVWGSLSDRFGRRPVMIATLLAIALGSLATALSTTLVALFAARIFAGMASGNVSTASAYITDVTDAGTRSRGMAAIGIAFAVGFTIGPGLGAWLSTWSLALPFLVAVGISVFNAGLCALILPEPEVHRQREGRARALPLLRRASTRRMCWVNLAYTVAMTFLEVPFAYYLLDLFQKGPRECGAIMAGLGIVVALVQGGVVRKLAPAIGDRAMSLWGIGLMGISLVLAPVFADLSWLIVMLTVCAVGRGLAQPGMLAVVSATGTPEEAGRIMGLYQSSASLGRAAGPILGGALYAAVHVTAPFFSAGAILLASALWWLSVRPKADAIPAPTP